MGDNDDDVVAFISSAGPPIVWNRRMTAKLMNEFKRLGPKVPRIIKNMSLLYTMISKTLTTEFKTEVSPGQVCNKLKTLKRKYVAMVKRGNAVEPDMVEMVKLLDQLTGHGNRRAQLPKQADPQIKAAVQSIKPANAQYTVEVIDDNEEDEGEVMDISQFLSKKSISKDTTCEDPLIGEEVIIDRNSSKCDSLKLSLLEKKVENRERNLEEKTKKNELIEERNRLIATLLTRKTKNDAIDAIRKDRLHYHREMKALWEERLEMEKKKLEEKKRKNDLLKEKNNLIKALIAQMSGKNCEVTVDNGEDDSPTKVTP